MSWEVVVEKVVFGNVKSNIVEIGLVFGNDLVGGSDFVQMVVGKYY